MMMRSTSERVWANFALLVALATVLVAVVRVYAWSGFFVPVALSVLSVADRTTLLASTLLLVLIALTPLLLSELIFSSKFTLKSLLDPTKSAFDAFVSYATVAGLALILVGFTSMTTILAIGGLLALFVLGWLLVILILFMKRQREKAAAVAKANLFSENRLRAWPAFYLLCGSLLLGVLSQSWVSIEAITRTDDSKPRAGYIIGEQGEFTLVINKAKEAEWVRTESITGRQLCAAATENLWSRTIADLLSPTLLPVCPDEAAGAAQPRAISNPATHVRTDRQLEVS